MTNAAGFGARPRKRRRPGSSVLSLALTVSTLLLPAVGAAAQTMPVVGEMPLSGGVAALLRVAEIGGAPDPSTALIDYVRVVHGGAARPSDLSIRYLEAVTRLHEAQSALPRGEVRAGSPGPPGGALRTWAAACGLEVFGSRLQEAVGADAAFRRRALEQAGMPVADWVERVNRGETVVVAIPTESVPLPLPGVWASAVLRGTIPRGHLAASILANRRAASIYHGLLALDDATLAFLGDHPDALSSMGDRTAGIFAVWGRSFRVRGNRVLVPGGRAAEPVWRRLLGADAGDPLSFLRTLLTRDGGRAAFFYDTVVHLDPARQAFALGAGIGTGREQRVHALYDAFVRTRTVEIRDGWPVVRHPVSPATVLREVEVDADGRMAAPAWQTLWETALDGQPQACSQARADDRRADAALLVDRVEREYLERRGVLLGAITFAQRVLAGAKSTESVPVCEVVAAYPRHDGLFLTLERLGFDQPADFGQALSVAARAWAGLDRRAAVIRTAQLQGVLLILERAVSARALSTSVAQQSLRSLMASSAGMSGQASAADEAAPALATGAIGRWLRQTLQPSLCRGSEAIDVCVVRAMAGAGPLDHTVVHWEEEWYRVDLGAASAVRTGRVLTAQRSTRLEEALRLARVAEEIARPTVDPDDLRRHVATLEATAPGLASSTMRMFGYGVPAPRSVVSRAAARLSAGTDARGRGETAADLVDTSDCLLADALVSLAYAIGIGDPDDPVLLDGQVARRHMFEATVGPALAPWRLPEEVQLPDRTRAVQGSILALRLVYARSWLRRLSVEDPGTRPRPDPQDVRGFGETAAAFSAFAIDDGSRDAIVAAIERGRQQVAGLLRSPDRLWQQAVGVSEWRCRAALWSAQSNPTRALALFSRGELMWLGTPDITRAQIDAWGAAVRTVDGRLSTRMPRGHAWEDYQGPRGVGQLAARIADIHLRVAEVLARLRLPAALAPDLAAHAAWDVLTSAPMAHPDDWLALVRAADQLSEDRLIDAVSALTAIGPLVPAAVRIGSGAHCPFSAAHPADPRRPCP